METEPLEGRLHIVKPGQTLWRIAKAYDKELEMLARINRIEDPTVLDAGTRLWIPGPIPADPQRILDGAPANAATTPPSSIAWAWPLPGGAMLDAFGAPRGHRRHQGIDIGAPRGSAVLAAQDGTVVLAATLRGYGRTVIVDHGAGWTTLYAHAARLLVEVGDKVTTGHAVAEVGRSGNATGPHLHFELRHDDRAVDPLRYILRTVEERR